MSVTRITQSMMIDGVLRNLHRNSGQAARLQEILSSGKQFSRPSQNPIGFQTALEFRTRIAAQRRYNRNIDRAGTNLSLTEVNLNSLSGIVSRARELTVQANNGTLGANERTAIAKEIRELLDEVVQIANTYNAHGHLFGGDRTQAQPFDFVNSDMGSFVSYAGDLRSREIPIGHGLTVNSTLNGMDAFFASAHSLTSAVRVSDASAPLAGQIPPTTPPLSGGTFSINGVSITFDPATQSLNDLRNEINRAGAGVMAETTENGGIRLVSTRSTSLTASDGTGTILSSLGLFHRVAGMDLGAAVTPATTLAGLGIVPEGLEIRVGDTFHAVNLSGAVTIDDVLNAINSSGAGVLARINAAGNGLEISATSLTEKVEVANSRAVFGSSIGAITRDTALASAGITPPALTSIDITNRGGTKTIDLSSAVTIGDVLDLISREGPAVTAKLNAAGNGIVIVSNIHGTGSEPLTVAESGAGTAAAQLGILGTASGDTASDLGIAVAGTIHQTDNVNIFQTLIDLERSLTQEQPETDLTTLLARLDRIVNGTLENLSTIGARMNRIEMATARVEQNELFLTELISENEDADIAKVVTQLTIQESVFQASLSVAARIIQPSLLDYLR